MAKDSTPHIAVDREENHDLSKLDLSSQRNSELGVADLGSEGLLESSIAMPKEFSKLRGDSPTADMSKVKKVPCLDTFVGPISSVDSKTSDQRKVRVNSEATGKTYSVSLGSGTLLDRVITWLAVQLRKVIDQLLAVFGMSRNKNIEEEDERLGAAGSQIETEEERMKKQWSTLLETGKDTDATNDPAYSRNSES